MNRKLIFIAWLAIALLPLSASAQELSARTVQYHSQDIVPIHAKVKYTTLIEVPPTEKIMEAATGDKDFWIVDVVGNFCFVHPARLASVPISISLQIRATSIRLLCRMCQPAPMLRTSKS